MAVDAASLLQGVLAGKRIDEAEIQVAPKPRTVESHELLDHAPQRFARQRAYLAIGGCHDRAQDNAIYLVIMHRRRRPVLRDLCRHLRLNIGYLAIRRPTHSHLINVASRDRGSTWRR
ncbi:MAG: hypothetical protein WCI96_14095, partial [Planctomycetota bacterium]